MTTTQATVDALNQAIDDGVRSVTIRGKTVIYNTTDSLIRARNDALERLAAETAAASTAPVRPSRRTLLSYAGRAVSGCRR